jgi:tetratricopeptide (TPR) repeat protein
MSTEAGRRWRPTLVFAIVVGIVMLSGAAVALRPKSPVKTVSAPAAPVLQPPRPSAPSSSERFPDLVRRGVQAAQDGERGAAISLLQQALELKPADAETWNTLGVLLVREGDTARGASAFSKALRFKPNYAEAHRNLAVVLDRQGRSNEAAAHYRAFLSLSPEHGRARDDVRRRLNEVSVSSSRVVDPK